MKVIPIREHGEMSFSVQVRLTRGVTPMEEIAFDRRVADWLLPRGLYAQGGQLEFTVLSERELSPTDQADMLIALLADVAVRQVQIGSIVVEGEPFADVALGELWVEVDKTDPLLAAARLLYEARRLDGKDFLAAMGGHTYRSRYSAGVL